MTDFDDVAKSLNNHFCGQCKRSFECDDEDGSCNCDGNNYGYPAWCDECVEAYDAEQKLREKEEEDDEDEDDD